MADDFVPYRPWERPSIVSIPKSPEQQMQEDAAVAYETAKARVANPRAGGLDSSQALEREIYSPFRKAWGMPDQAGIDPKIFEVNGSVVAVNPHTGASTPVYTSPTKPTTHEFEIAAPENPFSGQSKKDRLTLEDFVKQWDQLSDYARKSPANQAYLRAGGYDPETGRLSAPAPVSAPNPFGKVSFTRNGVTTTEELGKPKRPTRAMAADYVGKYGKGGAAEALKKAGYDLSGYAD